VGWWCAAKFRSPVNEVPLSSVACTMRRSASIVVGVCVVLQFMAAASAGRAVIAPAGNVSFPFPVAGYRPLAGSLVVVANAVNNTVFLMDTDSGNHLATTLLPSTPLSLEVDVLTASFWVVPTAGSFLMRGSILAGGHAAKVSLPCSPKSVAIGTSLVFVACPGTLLALSATSGSVLGTMTTSAGYMPIVASASDSKVFVANAGLSGAGGCMWGVDVSMSSSGTVSMAVSGTVQDCSNGEELVVSPNGKHVAFINGGGNCGGYSVCDFSGSNVSDVLGAWTTGAYPTAGSFSPDSSLFAITTGMGGPELELFGTQRHNRVALLNYQSSCTYTSYRQVLFSTDGHRVYSSIVCGFDETATQLLFFSV